MSNISVFGFDGQDIRFVDGKAVANDVATALGYADPAKTISTKVKDKNKGVTKMVTPGGIQSVTVLEEAGIYQLIFGSKLPSAEKFQDWVFEEVLPAIRKTGQYSTQTTGPANLVWFERLLLFKKKTQVPHGYFSIFGELTYTLISDFETAGYVLPDHSVIDISVGKCWSNFLKKSGVDISGLRMEYLHYYPDGRIVTSFIYKNELLSLFRDWVEMTYKSGPLVKYLSNRDPKALTTLYQMLGLPEG